MTRSWRALLVLSLFALPPGAASGASTIEFGAPVELDLGPGIPSELLAADLGNDEFLLAYQVGEDPDKALRAAVVDAGSGSTRISSTLSSSRSGTLLTDAFGDGQGRGGVVWIEGASPRVAFFADNGFSTVSDLPTGALLASSCLTALGIRVVVACEMTGTATAGFMEVYAFALASDGVAFGGPLQVSTLDGQSSGLASVSMDSAGSAWIAIRDQIPGDMDNSNVRVALLNPDGRVVLGAEPLGRTPYRAVLPSLGLVRQ